MPKFSALTALTGPNAAAGDLVCLDDVSVTTSKKMTLDDLLQACLVATSKAVLDESDNEWMTFVTTASAVNQLTVTNAATGTNPILSATGGDTNIGIALTPKGTGGIVVTGNGAALVSAGRQGATDPVLAVKSDVASQVTGVILTGRASGAGASIAAQGGATDEKLTIDGKGAGLLELNATGTGNVKVGTNLQLVSAGSVVDANGNEILKSAATVASAVNELTLTNSATGNPFLVAATGGDTNIGIKVNTKGSGTITLNDSGTGNVIVGTNLQHGSAKAIVDANGNESILFPASVSSAVNEFTISNAATAGAPTLAATGGDTNISVDLVPKGTGIVRARALKVDKVTQTAVTDTATLTIAQLLTGVIDGTPTAAADYTLPTAANLVAGIPNARVGDHFRFLINNKSGGANTITVLAGSGGTVDGTATIAQNVIRGYNIIVTNVTGASEAYFCYGEG